MTSKDRERQKGKLNKKDRLNKEKLHLDSQSFTDQFPVQDQKLSLNKEYQHKVLNQYKDNKPLSSQDQFKDQVPLLNQFQYKDQVLLLNQFH